MRCPRVRRVLSACLPAPVLLIALFSGGCRGQQAAASPDTRLAGDWDYYRMLGAAPNGGFEARRRMGVAHFNGPTSDGAWLKRRSGAPLDAITKLSVTGDDLVVSLDNGREIRAAVKGDTIAGQIYPRRQADRSRLAREARRPPVWEPNYELWPGDLSQPTFKVTIDPAVPMTARDGTTLMNYVAGRSATAPSASSSSARRICASTKPTASSGRRAATST